MTGRTACQNGYGQYLMRLLAEPDVWHEGDPNRHSGAAHRASCLAMSAAFFESLAGACRGDGASAQFVQDNQRAHAWCTARAALSIAAGQGKLVRVIRGRVLDVMVDIRRSSPSFGRWVSVELTEESHRQLWVPPGFAHGFVVLSDSADFLYKTTDYYAPEYEHCIRWDDPSLAIDWKLGESPLVSPKDVQGVVFAKAITFP